MDSLNLASLAEHFSDADKARQFLEGQRWPNGPVCPHCDSTEIYKLTPKTSKKGKHVRVGVYKCARCREQFTVTVGTIFEDSHIPLHKWLFAIHLLCASKKGMSAHQLHRMLGVTYKSAWFMAHRIRYAMSQPSFKEKLRGIVEADETYVGGKGKTQFMGRATGKTRTAVVSVIQRDGDARSFPVTRVTGENLSEIIRKNVDRSAAFCTDEFPSYKNIGHMFEGGHHTVTHSKGEYSREWVHVNSCEGLFATLKRGLTGVYHQVGQHHLHRYLGEFDFRYNTRKLKDGQRTLMAIQQSAGKRLMLRDSKEQKAG
ncbi:MAG TPA: IS1595 family transposase [Terriglobales bacterium]|nr:IS1595 family transposase [Terriglobales bacterium]